MHQGNKRNWFAGLSTMLRPPEGGAQRCDCRPASGVPEAFRGGRCVYLLSLLLLACSIVSSPLSVRADEYPTKAIRFIVGFPAGSTTDALARLIGQGLSEGLGVPVVIDNRAGASGIIGTTAGKLAAPDGYTLLLGNSGAILVGPSLHPKLPYSAPADFSPIGMIGSYPNVLVVAPGSGIKSVSDLVERAKREPNKLMYGSSGVGTTLHLSTALLQMQTGIDVVHVPYKDTLPVSLDLIEGRLHFAFASPTQMAPFVQSGRLNAIATTGNTRSPAFPNIPTVAESGFPEYNVVNWYSLLAPKGTPQAVVAKLNATLNAVLQRSDLREKFARDLDVTTTPSSPSELNDFIVKEQRRWANVIKASNIELN